jgi:hypothetical protein
MRFACKIAITAFMLSGWSTLLAQEKLPHGFLNIPFGATREAWLAELTSLYKMKPTAPCGLSQWPMYGSGMYLLWTSDNVYCLKNFALGDHRFTVLFYFNSDGKFYGFRMKEEKSNRSRIRNTTPARTEQMCESELTNIESQDLLEDVLFLQEVFEEKYGRPTNVQKYNADDICQHADRIFWIQKTSKYLAVVGTISTVFVGYPKNRPKMYSSVAVVYDQKLRNKPTAGASLWLPEGSLRAVEKHMNIQKAAGSF